MSSIQINANCPFSQVKRETEMQDVKGHYKRIPVPGMMIVQPGKQG
jgi:hypothetical protein